MSEASLEEDSATLQVQPQRRCTCCNSIAVWTVHLPCPRGASESEQKSRPTSEEDSEEESDPAGRQNNRGSTVKPSSESTLASGAVLIRKRG